MQNFKFWVSKDGKCENGSSRPSECTSVRENVHVDV